jgi:hypothetical protein
LKGTSFEVLHRESPPGKGFKELGDYYGRLVSNRLYSMRQEDVREREREKERDIYLTLPPFTVSSFFTLYVQLVSPLCLVIIMIIVCLYFQRTRKVRISMPCDSERVKRDAVEEGEVCP